MAKFLLPAVFGLMVLAWLEAREKRGLSSRQLPPQLRRRFGLWRAAISGGYLVLVLATACWGVFTAHRAPVVFHPKDETEWWFIPTSGGYEKLGLRATFSPVEQNANVFYAPFACTAVSLIIHRTNLEPSVMNVALSGLRAEYQMPATNPWTATFLLDKDTLVSWLHNGAGLDTAVPKLQEEAAEVYGLLKKYQEEPPQTSKEFLNLAKAGLRNFSFGGFQGGSGTYASDFSFFFYAALFVGETLLFITFGLWSTKRLFRASWAEIAAGRWTPPKAAPKRFTTAVKVLFALVFLSLADAAVAGTQMEARLGFESHLLSSRSMLEGADPKNSTHHPS